MRTNVDIFIITLPGICRKLAPDEYTGVPDFQCNKFIVVEIAPTLACWSLGLIVVKVFQTCSQVSRSHCYCICVL